MGDEPTSEPETAEAEPTKGHDPIVTPAPTADAPLAVSMAITIGATHYAVSRLAPAPGSVKAYRFVKG